MKKILSIILCAMLCISVTGCSSQSNSRSIQASSENMGENKNYSLELTNGTFKVGEDLEAGRYILVKNEGEYMGSFEITTDTTGDMDSSIDSNAFENFSYIKVKKGQYLQLDNCTLYIPKELGDKFDFSDKKELTNGMFRVGTGRDVEPGEYKLEITSDDAKAQGWYSLYNNLGGGYKGGPDLQDSDFFSGSKLITLREGQYLSLDSNTKLIK
ncbi:MAG: hypothetical protein ACLTG7_07040 [Romboutsia sp.]|nr:MAG TPA: protein of unknown function (DUF4969) [Caudoviricetes sp.]